MFATDKYFNIENFRYREIFVGLGNVWEALGKIGAYLESRSDWKIDCDIPEGAWLENSDRISIGEGSVVERGATIIGPAIIGRNCTIRQGAYIRGKIVTGDGCIIGHTTEVKNSIFLNNAKAAHFAYVGDSILGNGVNLGAGTKLANFKVDTGSRNVSIRHEGELINTGLRKMGAILGDNVEIGCNSVTMPGTLIGPGTITYPCMVLRGAVPGGLVVKLRQEHESAHKRTS